MQVKVFFDEVTCTLSYAVYDEQTRDAVIIDPVLNFDPASGQISTSSLSKMMAFCKEADLKIHLILETHAHADHLSSSQLIKQAFPKAKIAIGKGICQVQETFKKIYGFANSFAVDGSQFDRLLVDHEVVHAGTLSFKVLSTPGHTPSCISFLFTGHIFTGDTLFMPDYGTGRTDFPGGDAGALYDSITQKLYSLPDSTKVLTGHDYMPLGRPMRYECTIGEQKISNIHLTRTTPRDEFVKFRKNRDAHLSAPRLLHPSVQVNIDAGHLPNKEANGVAYLKIPLSESPEDIINKFDKKI